MLNQTNVELPVIELTDDELSKLSAGKNDNNALKFDVPGESTGGHADRWIESF